MANDGWTKLHYKQLYKKRLKQLKYEKHSSLQ